MLLGPQDVCLRCPFRYLSCYDVHNNSYEAVPKPRRHAKSRNGGMRLGNQPNLEVVWVPTDELSEYDGNAKLHPSDQIDQIASSIEEFSFADPIGAWHDDDGNAVIVEGHGRLLAARRLGIGQLPVIFLDHLSDEQRRAYGLVHNQLTMNSGFDLPSLSEELEGISSIDMEVYGFVSDDDEELEEVHPSDEPVRDRDHGDEPSVSPGDRWVLGDHVLVCGDSTTAEAYELLMGNDRADLLLTDPPYNVDYASKNKSLSKIDKQNRIQKDIENDSFGDDSSFTQFLIDSVGLAMAHVMPGGSWYVWFAVRKTGPMYDAMRAIGAEVRQELYWLKNMFVIGRQDYQWQTEPCIYGWTDGAPHWFAPTRSERNFFDELPSIDSMGEDELRETLRAIASGEAFETDLIRENKPQVSDLHPTMKPVSLFQRLIRNSSREGDLVLDPFGGSGTTIVACENMGRRARVIEIDPEYCAKAIARWEQLTGLDARLETDEQGGM